MKRMAFLLALNAVVGLVSIGGALAETPRKMSSRMRQSASEICESPS